MRTASHSIGKTIDLALITGCVILFVLIAQRLWHRAAPRMADPAARVAPMEEGAPMIDFILMEMVQPDENYHPIYSDTLKSLNGKEVRMRGFMMPYESTRDLSTFILYPAPSDCPMCVGPTINEVALIRQAASPRPQALLEGPIEVTGRLNLWRVDSEDPAHTGDMFLFVLDEAGVTQIPASSALPQTGHWRHTRR